MTMPKFEPACYWIEDAEQFHIGLKPFALAWKPLHTADQLTEAYEAGKRDAIPEGWVLVPKEPTEIMLVLGQEEYALGPKGAIEDCIEAQDIYAAMLAAAPKGAE